MHKSNFFFVDRFRYRSEDSPIFLKVLKFQSICLSARSDNIKSVKNNKEKYWKIENISPYQIYLTNLLESVQHKFSRHLSYKFFVPMSRFDHNYSLISKQVGLFSIKSTHCFDEAVFTYKFLTSTDKHPALADLFTLRVQPYSVRYFRGLKEENCTLNSTFNYPILDCGKIGTCWELICLMLHLYRVLKMLLSRYYYNSIKTTVKILYF